MPPSPIPRESAPGVRQRRWLTVLLVAGAAGWLSFTALMARMYAQSPPGAGFDLELLLTGGRRVAAGLSPYEPAMLAGQSVGITTLFFSYPPLVGQALSPLAPFPSVAVLAALLVAAPLAAGAVAVPIGRLHGVPLPPSRVFLAALAALPFWFPFTLAMLFGNLDTLFVAGYGLVLLAVLPAVPSRTTLIGAGIALALMSVTKLHPAVLGVWLLARGVREARRGDPGVLLGGLRLPRSWSIAAVAAAAALVVLGVSLVVGGVGPWADYVTVLRASTIVDLLDARNLGPAVQVALLLGLGHEALAPMQVVVVVGALAVSIVAALAVDDPLESLLWAAFASLVPLPVTWFHHFAVLYPFGVAAVCRAWTSDPSARRRAAWLVGLAVAVGVLGFGQVFAWLLVPVALVLARVTRPHASAAPPAGQAVAAGAASAG